MQALLSDYCDLDDGDCSHSDEAHSNLNLRNSTANDSAAEHSGARRKISEESDFETRKKIKAESPKNSIALEHDALIASLSTAIAEIVPSLTLERERSAAWHKFESICRNEFSAELSEAGSSIEVFGSWTYGMWIASSDIDVNFMTKNCIPQFFARLKSAVVRSNPSASFTFVAKAKVPVAKMTLSDGLQIDITHEYGLHNEVAAHHVLVREWAQRWKKNFVVCTAIRLVKQWAKSKRIMNPCGGSLNSMGYLILLLAVAEPDDDSALVGDDDSHAQTSKVLKLLRSFFSSYTTLGTKRQVIFAPHGVVESEGLELDILRLSSQGGAYEHRGAGVTVFIQDPFLASTNLGRFVDRYSAKTLRDEFSKAAKILQEGGADAMHKLMSCR